MNCTQCESDKTKRFGKDRKGNQRFRCLACGITFQAAKHKPLGEMQLAIDKAIAVLRILAEGCSIRSTERLTGVHRDTILSLLETVGEKCHTLMSEVIQGVSVKEVQCDEIWGFCGMKQKTAKAKGKENDEAVGDAWCFIAMERHTKLALAWHLGRRTAADTLIFTESLAKATKGRFQVNTDGFAPYRDAMEESFGANVDFAQIIKIFGLPDGDDRRYSPPTVIDIKKVAVAGNPDLDTATTSHIERQNLTVRMQMRRMTRLTNAFSKKFENLRYAYALYFFHYNFMRVHSTLRVTPAQEAGLTATIWTWKDLLATQL